MAVNWPKIHLLESRLRWWRGKAGYRRRELLKWKATGDRSHYWHDVHVRKGETAAAKKNEAQWPGIRKEIGKWSSLLNEAEREIHALERAIQALKPKAQFWPMGGLVAPGEHWRPQRFDQGRDFEIPLGNAIRAPGSGVCVEYAHDREWPIGFGSPYVIVRLEDGLWHDVARHLGLEPEFYAGHCNDPIVSVGEHFSFGAPLTRTDHSMNQGWGWCEWGHWAPGGMGEGERFAAACAGVWR